METLLSRSMPNSWTHLQQKSVGFLLVALLTLAAPLDGRADDGAIIDAEADIAIDRLLADIPSARPLLDDAAGVLIFPNVVKGGFWLGGLYGEGALRQNGETTAYYNIAAASLGFQIGAQSFSYILIFTTPESMSYLDDIQGFGVGGEANAALGPNGLGGEISTTTLKNDVVSFQFGQTGLMAGLSLEGSKITQVDR